METEKLELEMAIQDAPKSLKAELHRLHARVAELEAMLESVGTWQQDAKRLKFLIENRVTVASVTTTNPAGKLFRLEYPDGWQQTEWHKLPMEAIDAAIAAQGGGAAQQTQGGDS